MASRFAVNITGTKTWTNADTSIWSATSGGASGASVPGSGDTVTFDANSGSGTCQPDYDFTVTSITMSTAICTLDFSANNNNPTMTTFVNTGSSTRGLNLGNGTWTITGNAATVWSMATVTNLTFSANSSTINFTYSGSTGTRTINFGNTLTYNNISISAGSDATTFGSTITANTINFSGYTGSMGLGTWTILGSLTLGTGQTVTSATSTLTFAGTSGTQTITSNGVQMNKPITINAPGATVTLADALDMDGASSRAFTFTAGTFDTNNKNVKSGSFSGSNSNVRTLTLGSSTWTIVGSGATVWTQSVSTNLTFNAGTSTIDFTYSGGTGTRTITTGVLTYNNIKISAGSDIISSFTSTVTINNLDFTGFSGNWANTVFISFTGNLTFATGMTTTTGTGTYSFIATSGTQTITSNGVSNNHPITINAPGATVQLVGNMDITGSSQRLLTITAGTFTDNNYTISAGTFASTGTAVRNITVGSGGWSFNGTNATVYNVAATNLTLTQATPLMFTYSGSTNSRTFQGAQISVGGTEANTFAISITAGTDTITFTGSNRIYKNLNFTGFSGTMNNSGAGMTNYGNLTFATGMTVTTNTGILSLLPSTSATLTSNGVQINQPLTIAATGIGSITLADALNVDSQAFRLTTGTFITNNFNVMSGSFTASAGTVTLGSSTFTLVGTSTVWSFSSTVTLTANTSTIVINDSTSATKTFSAGSTATTGAYYNLVLGGTGTGTFVIGTTTAINTFNNITVQNPPHTVQIFAGKTIAVSSITWSGTAGNLNTFQSTSIGTQWYIVKASGTVDQDYISLQDSNASGGAQFNAGAHSTDVSNNTGWFFSAEDNPNNASRDENRVPTLLATSNSDGRTVYKVFADATTHILQVDDNNTGSDLGPTNAPRDENRVTSLMGVSSVDGVTPVVIYLDPATQKLLVKST